uniref:Uncharacterized protein n=1 Tax=viral metagenome TaxID=1070528 RepID=A0A6C0D6K7_9ZZZZ
MEVIVIILIVIVVILAYYLYRLSTKKNDTASQLYYLNTPTIIGSDTLTNPKSARFSYTAWVFVNTWNIPTNTANMNKVLYKAQGGSPAQNIIELNLTSNKPILKTTVYNDQIIITNNFPIQKWVYVVISVDSSTVDCYLDGKLIVSRKLNNIVTIPSTYAITIGPNPLDTYITGFKYYDTPLNPQQVWSYYMAGNGYVGGKYTVNLEIKKDNKVITSFPPGSSS